MRQRQRGVTFLGMVFIGVTVAVIGLLMIRLVPSYMEYQAISKAAQQAADMGTTANEVRAAFERAKTVQYFDAIGGNDLEITRVNDRLVVEFAYSDEIPLFGPAYLVFKYQGRTR